MRMTAEFREFLDKTVNLNATRIATLESRVDAIERFLESSAYEPAILRFAAQGSWAHETIIKPPSHRKEFDADLVVYVKPVTGWEPEDYILELRRTFRDSSVYRDKTSMKSRCVTINYSGDFHLDVVPIIDWGGWYQVCNRNENAFETTDGDGFADWWRQQSDTVGGDHLIECTRLLKYLRDIKTTFAAKSILLTTLIGDRVNLLDSILDRGQFEDTPTTLKTILGRLDDWLEERPTLPDVVNPAMQSESFTRHWDQEKYTNFRNQIAKYREWIDDAYEEEDRTESIRKWRRIFGKGFARGEAVTQGRVSVAALAEQFMRDDLVAAVHAFGSRVLQRIPKSLPHMEAPHYGFSGRRIPVRIRAFERLRDNGPNLRELSSADSVEKGRSVRFEAVQQVGLPFSDDYLVSWQTVNTDDEAAEHDDLRGEFSRARRNSTHTESIAYRGVHWVQAFLVSKRTGKIDGVSDRFFVVVL